MLAHFDQHLGRLVDVLEATGQLADTVVLITSDNGASQEGGPLGFVNAMGPFNMVAETMEQKLARIDDICGPDTHSNFPHGWAMAASTPLKRYKQNTHGGGVRDALIISAPDRPVGPEHAGTLRHQFCHVVDLAPTVLDLLGIEPAEGMTGVGFAGTLADRDAVTGKTVQYFEMFCHRGIWQDDWKAVAYHWPGTPFENDRWELYDLATDMNEVHDLSAEQPGRLAALQAGWWEEAVANRVLPLDDRFGERVAGNAARHTGARTRFTFWSGMGHVPSEVAPDLRSRSYRITAHINPSGSLGSADGVLLAHGDATSGYALFVRDGHLVHDLSIRGTHQLVTSDRPFPPGATTLGFTMARHGEGPFPHGTGTLLVDAEPNAYTGHLVRVTVDLLADQQVDHDAAGAADLARE